MATDASGRVNPELEVIKAPDARLPLPKIHRKVAEPVQPRQRSTRVRVSSNAGWKASKQVCLGGDPGFADSSPRCWYAEHNTAPLSCMWVCTPRCMVDIMRQACACGSQSFPRHAATPIHKAALQAEPTEVALRPPSCMSELTNAASSRR